MQDALAALRTKSGEKQYDFFYEGSASIEGQSRGSVSVFAGQVFDDALLERCESWFRKNTYFAV